MGSLMLTKKPIIRADRNTTDLKNILSYEIDETPVTGKNLSLHKGKLDELNNSTLDNIDKST